MFHIIYGCTGYPDSGKSGGLFISDWIPGMIGYSAKYRYAADSGFHIGWIGIHPVGRISVKMTTGIQCILNI